MKREFQSLHGGPFDLLVIGGGVYGAWIACDAALRGLGVALVEQQDWGAGTSSASSKLIHGGLRYLEYFEFGLVRKALAERKRLAELGPHRVRPLRFVLPVYRGDRVGRWRFAAGLTLYDWLAGRGQPVARHASFGRHSLAGRWPFLAHDGLRGGFTYGDCGTDDARLVLEVVAGALEAGAVAVNHARAVELLREDGRAAGAVVQDELSSQAVEVRARLVVAAAGPWAGELLGRAGGDGAARPPLRLLQGSHLVMPALPCPEAFLLTAEDGRIFFLIPWYGRTLLGTTERDYRGDPARAAVTPEERDYLLRNANRRLRDASRWSESDVQAAFTGVRGLRQQEGRKASAVSREWELEEPLPRLLLPVGGKLTSARADAAQAVARIARRLDFPEQKSPTAVRPFPWRPPGDFGRWLEEQRARGVALGLDQETAVACASRYGLRVALLHERIRAEPDLARRILPDLPFCRAELRHAVASEMACTVDDVLRRRVPLAILAPPAPEVEREVAALLAAARAQ